MLFAKALRRQASFAGIILAGSSFISGASAAEATETEEIVETSEAVDPADEEVIAGDAIPEQQVETEASTPLLVEEDLITEKPGQAYYQLGIRYRGLIIPQFIFNWFADGGQTLYENGLGADFTIRKDNAETTFALWYAGLQMGPTYMKGKSDGDDAWEQITSKLGLFLATVDLNWSTPIVRGLDWTYGFGIGLGIVTGSLTRWETYGYPNLQPCNGPGSPDAADCPTDGNYGEVQGWTNGGSLPAVFPWMTVQTGLRYKFHEHIAANTSFGVGTTGFNWGLGVGYIF